MTKAADRKSLTELEGAALAIIAREGPLTPYAVKEAFRNSPSEFWSGSAGAVYPLINRLEKRKLISAKADKGDGRARREFSITAAGRTAMKEWLVDAERAAGMGFDPLRTRLFFSELITPAERKAFIAAALARMEDGAPAPAVDLPHVKPLHDLWSRLRVKALKAFAEKMK
jgi:DNA-binding PadR family transcriptional regulator